MDTLTIGRVAKEAAVGVETIRFYEREGLIANPPRLSSGYRAYPPETVARIRFIRTAKDLGFSLKEIRELLSMRVDPIGSCSEVRAMAESKITDVEERIRVLQNIRLSLERLVTACEERQPTSECPILDCIEKEELK